MTEVTEARSGEGAFYAAVWRWHFYAGLIVLPVLAWLAITGGLYLYKPEIEKLVYARWSVVEPMGEPVRLEPLIAAVEQQAEAKVVQVMRPADPAASWRMTLVAHDGSRNLAFVDPWRQLLLHRTDNGGLMQTVRELHSLIITGPVGNLLVEVVAGWAVLLVATGLYLWWPRRGSPMIGLRGHPAGRMFWRDLHASVGVVAAGIILFLATTGMPWTGVTGKVLQGIVATQGIGRPKTPGPNPWEAAKGHDHRGKETLPWSMQEAGHPTGDRAGDIGPDRVAKIAAAHGLAADWTMTLPASPAAPYLVSRTIVRAEDARALYVEAASGKLLQDVRYDQFGIGARTIEWGIATHQGQQYGEVNRLIILAGCLSVVLLAATGPVLWWKRRRNGQLAAPPRVPDRRKARGVAAIMLAIGAMFPITGVSLIMVLAVDRLVLRMRGTVR